MEERRVGGIVGGGEEGGEGGELGGEGLEEVKAEERVEPEGPVLRGERGGGRWRQSAGCTGQSGQGPAGPKATYCKNTCCLIC